MPFGLTIGTERATALQQSIQDELTRRNYSAEPDAVMAEYITIMIINNKTASQITSELEDLIGTDFDPTFTDWLFAEAAKGAAEIPPSAPAESSTSRAPEPAVPQREAAATATSSNDVSRRPRNGVYQQAISQAIPSTSPASQKRTASARSPSPNHSNKIRRTDVPTGPRAMFRDGPSNPRSLLDRVGGPGGAAMRNNFGQDEVQSRIDNIVNNPTPEQQQAMMMNAGFPMGMEMMNPAMANPIMLQEMMMNQMALMAQMASTMGIINPATGQFGGPAFGGMPGDISMYPGGIDGFQGPAGGNGNYNGRGRGNPRGRGIGRSNGRGGGPATASKAVPDGASAAPVTSSPFQAVPIVAPTPATAVSTPALAATGGLTGFILPERPQSPTLCKFGLKCTNAHCRYSHASPVATPESGVVLSNEACDKGKECKDKDCIKAHVSPAVLNPQSAVQPPPPAHHQLPAVHHAPTAGAPCRFGVACTRAGCTFTHPPGHPSHAANSQRFAQPCHFGSACTRADCHFQHPEGRVLPTTFHRGLSTSAPLVSVPTPETGSMGAASHHRSVTFNQSGGAASVKDKLEKQMREIEQKKSQAEKAVKAAEEAANAKKDNDVKAVTISA
ncbi:hypothetical protein B0H12DRAFT_1236187 [Mycena haematopus]|nr:hypothetical protein B0H12DRAFT_1236187 [Mycena haematopus]